MLIPKRGYQTVALRLSASHAADDNRPSCLLVVSRHRYHCWVKQSSPSRSGAFMKIHEYQAKEILRKYGVAVPAGEMATTLEEADAAAKQLFSAGNSVVVIKAQIHAGGRGKGGGVKLAKSIEQADEYAK